MDATVKRSGPIKRKTRLKAKGGSRFPKRRCQPYLDWLREQRCCVLGHPSGAYVSVFQVDGVWKHGWPPSQGTQVVIDPAHITSRNAGGDDLYNAVSLAHHLHEEQHRIGIRSFQAKYGVDLKEKAKEQTEQWLQTPEGQEWGSQPR